MAENQPLRVAVGLLQRGNLYLLGKRPAGKDHAGLWEFPGGKFEPGESLLQALTRELREELDIQLQGCQMVTIQEHDYGGYRVQLEIARATGWLGQPQARVHDQLGWFSLPQIARLELPAANYAILDLLQSAELASAR